MNNPLGVSPSKGKQGTTRGKEKILLSLRRDSPSKIVACVAGGISCASAAFVLVAKP